MNFSTRVKSRKGVEVILGPPGTGKTTTLMGELAAALDGEITIEDIAFTSYTRAAIHEAKDRAQRQFAIPDDGFVHWGTTHSLSKRLIGHTRESMWTDDDQTITKRFCEKHYYSDLMERRCPWNRGESVLDYLRGAINLARCRLVNPQHAAYNAGQDVGVDGAKFFGAWQQFKRDEGVIDFTDLLERAILLPAPRTRMLFVDEAQDLNPLQARFVEGWIAKSDLALVAGDDDQAIMAFQGGDATWLQGLARAHPTRVLDQSYRIPGAVHGLAMRVVHRILDRVEKVFRARPESGWLDFRTMSSDVIESLIEDLDHGSVGYLCRLGADLVDVTKELLRLGVPYRCPRDGADPLGPNNTKLLPAAQAVRRMATGHRMTAGELDAILDAVKVRELGLKHGCKSNWQNAPNRPSTVTEDTVMQDLRPLWSIARAQGCAMLASGYGSYYDQVISPDGDLPKRHIMLSTIHSSKGREWDSVYLNETINRFDVDSLANRGSRDADDVHRLSYVGATRARHSLTIVSPGVFGRHGRGGRPTPTYYYGR